MDLAHDLFDCPLTAIEDGTQLDGGGFNNSHHSLLGWRITAME
jgi:hypothetical protein